MAGRPVTVRSGQSTLLYWVITFTILWMVALGLFIFQLVNNKSLQNSAESAQRRVREYGSPPQYYRDEAQARRSNVFAVMEDDLRSVANLVTGSRDDVGPTILGKADGLLQDIGQRKPEVVNAGDTVLTALERLDKAHTTARDTAEASQIELRNLQADNAALTAQLKSKDEQYQAEIASISEQLRQVQDEKIEQLQAKDDQLQDVQATLNAREQQLIKNEREGSKDKRDLEIEIGRLQSVIGSLHEQIKTLKPSTFDPDKILTKADGRILRAVPGSDVVYIDLGAADRVKVGMGFEVYSRMYHPTRELRGKASLEVVTVMERTSECRVTRRTPGQPLIESDNVVNIAFERERKPRFVISGEFDLNYDSKVDFDGRVEVTAMIERWGGVVVDELDETVDFVLIGRAPFVPELPEGKPVSDIVRDQAQQRALAEGEFQALVTQAQRMYIPVITQSQFLYLIGDVRDMTVFRE